MPLILDARAGAVTLGEICDSCGMSSVCISRPLFSRTAAAALAALLAIAPPAAAGIADQVGATFGLMLQDVVSAFPPVEGVVVRWTANISTWT